MNAQLSDFLIRSSISSGIPKFDGSDGSDGCNVKFWQVGILIEFRWCKLGQDLVDMLLLDFLWVSGVQKVLFFGVLAAKLLFAA